MADIIDRLITRVEFVGVAAAIGQMRQFNQGFQAYKNLAGPGITTLNRVGAFFRAIPTSAAIFGSIATLAFTQLTKQAADTAIQFEHLRTSLHVLYRDASMGDKAFDWITEFAKTTPFSIESATQAFIRLTSLGIQPTRKNLMLLGGLGQMFHRDFEDVAMAVGIGSSGNFSRLIRGFGITRAMVARNAAPGVIPSAGPITNQSAAFDAILKTIEQKFPEAFTAFSNTMETARSNFYDSVQQTLVSFFNLVLGANNLKQAFDTLTTAMGFVNNFIKVLSIFRDAILWTVLQLMSIIPSILGHLLPGVLGKAYKASADIVDTASRAVADRIFNTAMGMSKYANTGEPPKPPLPDMGGISANGIGNVIRNAIGGGLIAQIGIAPSEIAGIRRNANRPLKIEVLGKGSDNIKAGIEDIINDYEEQKWRAGYATAGFG